MKKNRGEKLISLSPSTNSSIEEYKILGHHVLPLSTLLVKKRLSFTLIPNTF